LVYKKNKIKILIGNKNQTNDDLFEKYTFILWRTWTWLDYSFAINDNGYQTTNNMSDLSSSTCWYVSYSHFSQKEGVFNEIIIINIERKHVLIRC